LVELIGAGLPIAVPRRIVMGPKTIEVARVAVDANHGHHEDRTPAHGYEPTREAAMAAFKKSWRRTR
jgi:hypothetical protein